MFDNRFPYTDITKINLDWILRTLKNRIESAGVSSINGQTGDVILNAIDVGAFPGVIKVETAGEDINTYTEPGIWYFPLSYQPVNKPDGASSGFLIVLKSDTNARLVQVWLNNSASNNKIYSRNNPTNSVNWTIDSWVDYATDENTVVRGNVKKNNTYFVNEFLAVAKTYYDNRSNIVYGNDTFLDEAVVNNQLDCSTFVGLCFRGIPFEDTPLNPAWSQGAQNPMSWTANTAKYTWAWNPYDYNVVSVRTGPCRGASQFGRLLNSWGQRVPMDEKWCNLEPGDIVFYSAKNQDGTWHEPNTWGHISHVAICYSKTDTPINGYPFTHRLIDVNSGGTSAVDLTTLETSGHKDEISLVCRPDFGALIANIPEELAVTIPAQTQFYNDNVTVSAYRVDKLVCVRIVVERNADVADNNYHTLASGLPHPVLPSTDSNGHTINYGFLGASDGSVMYATIGTTGTVRAAWGNVNTRYSGTVWYFCE